MGTKKGTFASKWAHPGFFEVPFVVLHKNEGCGSLKFVENGELGRFWVRVRNTFRRDVIFIQKWRISCIPACRGKK